MYPTIFIVGRKTIIRGVADNITKGITNVSFVEDEATAREIIAQLPTYIAEKTTVYQTSILPHDPSSEQVPA